MHEHQRTGMKENRGGPKPTLKLGLEDTEESSHVVSNFTNLAS